MAFSPLAAYPVEKVGNSTEACEVAMSDDSHSQIKYLEDIIGLDVKFVNAIHKYLEAPKNRKPKKIVEYATKVAMGLGYLTFIIPIYNTVRAVRGDTRLKNPEKSSFRVYKKTTKVNDEDKEQLIVVKGSPKVMKNQDRKELEELVSHFKRIGLAKPKPRVRWKEIQKRFNDGDLNWLTGFLVTLIHGAGYLWEAGTRRAPRWLFVHSLWAPIPMPNHWRPLRLPLQDDIKHMRLPVYDAKGKIVSYKKFKMSKDEIEVYYLLDKYDRNLVADADRWGGDVRAAAVLLFIYSAISDWLHMQHGGHEYFELSWGTKWPVVALAVSRLIATTLNMFQQGNVPAINKENAIKLMSMSKVFLQKKYVKILKRLKKDNVDPGVYPEYVFEKYNFEIEKDDYIEKAFIAFFGHQPIEKDGALVGRTKQIGSNLGPLISDFTSLEYDAISAFQKLLKSKYNYNFELEEVESMYTMLKLHKKGHFPQIFNPSYSDVASVGFVNKKGPVEFYDDSEDETDKKQKSEDKTSDYNQSAVFETPISDGRTMLEDTISKFPGEPLIILSTLEETDGISHQLEKLGFIEVIAEPKVSEDAQEAMGN